MYAKCFCFFSCFLFCLSAQSQDVQQNRLDSFSGKLIASIRAQARPRAYLTTDKSIFRTGETIWFRASVLNAVSQKVNTKSKYLFVDLVNENDNVLKTVLLDAASQQLSAKIVLPNTMPAGYYWLRAYTRQMAETDTNNCAVTSIYVFNPKVYASTKSTSKTTNNKKDDTPVINFYPEGGSLITGASSTVAFRIHDEEERSIVVEGVVKDNLGSLVANFASVKNGLGKFSFSPSRYRQYKAYITWNGREVSYPLPAFNFTAGQLSVTNQAGANRLVRVLLEDSVYSKDFVSYVIGIAKDSFCFAAIGRGQYEIVVPDQKFPEGIATFYLFDNTLKLLSERSIYVKENNVIVKALVDKGSYDKRSKVTLNISVTNKDQQPISSLFSVAVIDSLFSDPSDGCNLPWFNETNKQKVINNITLARMQCLTNEEMDLIMLLRNNTYPTTGSSGLIKQVDDADSFLNLKGSVVTEKNEPAVNRLVTLFSKSGNGVFETDTTDNMGRFYFPVEGYGDSTQFSITVKSLSGKNQQTTTLPDTLHLPTFKTPVSLKNHYSSEPVIAKYRRAYMEEEFAESDKARLPEIILVSKKTLNDDVSKRISQSSSILIADDIAEGTSLGNAVLGVAGLHLLNGFLVINGLTSMAPPNAGSEPLILVEGVQASLSGDIGNGSPAISFLNTINSKDVDFIEILKGADGANYGIRGGNGVILLNMAKNRKDNFSKGPSNVIVIYPKGIFNHTAFPLINYDNNKINGAQVFDRRSTIFWNGDVLAGSEKNTTFSFFTGDIAATYKVIISGITVHGDLVYKTLTFKCN